MPAPVQTLQLPSALVLLNTGRVAGMLLSNGETGNLPSASECLVSKRAEVQAKNSISISYSALPAPASIPLYSAESAASR